MNALNIYGPLSLRVRVKNFRSLYPSTDIKSNENIDSSENLKIKPLGVHKPGISKS